MADKLSTQYWTARYKNDIINLLITNEFFVKLMSPSTPKNENLDVFDVLLGGQWNFNGQEYKEEGYIFDYVYSYYAPDVAKTFVFIEAFPSTIENNMMVDFDLYVYICTHRDLIRLYDSDIFSLVTSPTVQEVLDAGFYSKSRGNRLDTLCDCVDRILNGNEFIKGIGRIKAVPRGYVKPYIPSGNFYGKCLTYHITNLKMDGDICANQ